MKTEETVYENEATRFEDLSVESGAGQTENSAKAKNSSFWRNAAAGLGMGIVLGTVSSFATASTVLENGEDDSNPQGQTGEDVQDVQENWSDDQVPVADVNDDMSFSEAFSTARAQVGPGGAFEWRGNVYSTYTSEEWENMSAEQKSDYYSHFVWSGSSDSSSDAQAGAEAEVVDGVPVAESTPENPVEQPDDNVEVEVLGVVHDDETGANIAGVLYDGQEVILVDVDNDNKIDVLASDLNGDGTLTADEMVDVSDQNIRMDDLTNQSMYTMVDGPDYTNDASVNYDTFA